ncbi:MAG: hypothetical protein ACI85I_000651 [Arenicella sp.]|jgi:hypothetical protein
MLSRHFARLVVLIAFTSAVFSSCETEILKLDGTEDGVQYVDTVGFELVTMITDSVNTTNQSRLLVGKYSDINFGSLKATSYSNLVTLIDSVNILLDGVSSDSIYYDSAVLNLEYDYVYGDIDFDQKQYFMINELTSPVDTTTDKEYYKFESILPLGNTLADTLVQPNDSTNVFQFKLDDTFGQKIYDKAVTGDINTSTPLSTITNGISISTDDDAKNMYGFNAFSSINIYYHYISGGDTLNASILLLFAKRFHQLEQDLSGTPLALLSPTNPITSTSSNNLAYIQSGVGIYTYLKFNDSEINEFSFTNKIAINSAKLYLSPAVGTNSEGSSAPPLLQFPFATENREFATINDEGEFFDMVRNDAGSILSLSYNSRAMEYPLPASVTNYVENVANGDIDNNGFFITGEVFQTNTGLDLSASNINKLVIGNRKYDNPVGFPTQLRIFYTKFE